MHFNTNVSKFKSIAYGYSNHTARKTIFPRSWNIKESSKRPRKYHLSINFLAEKKDHISHHRKDQNKNFTATSKYRLSINFLTQKKTVFPITEKFKTRTFQNQ